MAQSETAVHGAYITCAGAWELALPRAAALFTCIGICPLANESRFLFRSVSTIAQVFQACKPLSHFFADYIEKKCEGELVDA